MQERFHMIAVMQFFSSWLSLSPATPDRASAGTGSDNVGRQGEPPIMLAEVIAASSFLDFGGIPDARYFHTLYDWRLSEAERCSTNTPSREGHHCHGIPLRRPKRNFQRRF
jgi:hypothetical protein